MTTDDRATRALASMVPLLTPAQYAELHLRVTLELRAERERCAQVAEELEAVPEQEPDGFWGIAASPIAAAIRALD